MFAVRVSAVFRERRRKLAAATIRHAPVNRPKDPSDKLPSRRRRPRSLCSVCTVERVSTYKCMRVLYAQNIELPAPRPDAYGCSPDRCAAVASTNVVRSSSGRDDRKTTKRNRRVTFSTAKRGAAFERPKSCFRYAVRTPKSSFDRAAKMREKRVPPSAFQIRCW